MQKNISGAGKYFLLMAAGLLLLMACSLIQDTDAPQPGEYDYSSFLRNNYTILSASLFLLVGMAAGYFLKVNPWLAGLSLILIFPIVSLYEATVYRGSHNLLPVEFIVYFLWALPGVAGVYIGKYIQRRKALSKSLT